MYTMDERFVSVLEDAFPEREIPETPAWGPSINERNGTVPVEFDDGERVFCKIAVDGDRTRLDRERAILEYVGAQSGVLVPSVLASDPDGPVPYLVTASISDESRPDGPSDPDSRSEATEFRVLGRTLARVHSLRFDAHGDVVGGGSDHLDVDTGSWTDVFVGHVRGIPEFAHSDVYDRHVDDVVAALKANREKLDAAPAVLVHNDPNEGNCRCYHEDGVGLIDWETAHVGDPARDLFRVLEQRFGYVRPEGPAHLIDALHEGYRDQAGKLPDGFAERTRVYELERVLAAAALIDIKAKSLDESRQSLVDWVETEMARRLEAVR